MSATSPDPSQTLTRANKTRGWGDRDQPTDRAGTEADSRPFALQTVIPQHPGDSADGSSEIGDDAGLGGAQIRS